MWWLWTYPTTDEGFQLVAIVLAACNFVLLVDACLPHYRATKLQVSFLMATHFWNMMAFLMENKPAANPCGFNRAARRVFMAVGFSQVCNV